MSTLHGQKSKISVCGYVYVRACVRVFADVRLEVDVTEVAG